MTIESLHRTGIVFPSFLSSKINYPFCIITLGFRDVLMQRYAMSDNKWTIVNISLWSYSVLTPAFHCHATKNILETVQWKKQRKLTAIKDIYKQFVQVSGPCGQQFLSYLSKRFTQRCRALYGDAILEYRFGAPIWPPEINENIWSSLFL